MAFRNIKINDGYEYLGTIYQGISIPDGVEIKVGQTYIDGLPPVLIFEGAVEPYPTINATAFNSISKHTSAAASFYVVTKA